MSLTSLSDVPSKTARASAVADRLFSPRLRVAQIDDPVLGEPRMQRDIEKTGKHPREHTRRSGDRSGIELSVANDAQPALALGDQHAAVRQEREAPWMRQSRRHGDDADRKLRGEECVRQRRWRRRRSRRLRRRHRAKQRTTQTDDARIDPNAEPTRKVSIVTHCDSTRVVHWLASARTPPACFLMAASPADAYRA